MSQVENEQNSGWQSISAKYGIPADYLIIACICALFAVTALVLDTPARIVYGLYKINASRSILVTDYIAFAGVGAALVNSALMGILSLFLLISHKCRPNGRIIAGIFVTIGFSLFGKNLFNTLPIMFGIWLHGKAHKEPFSNLIVQAMASGTIAPLVSEIAFLNNNTSPLKILAAYSTGLLVGLVFPVVIEAVKRMHRGYCLYNAGIAGGFIATIAVGLLRSAGISVLPEKFWDTTHSVSMAFLIYFIAAALIVYGIIREKPRNAFRRFRELMKERDVNDNDYFEKYGNVCYINIGVMCIVTTSLMLWQRIPINGPVLGGILTATGYACAGKHLKNTLPILVGSLAAVHLNIPDHNNPQNSLAILFSTGLAPACGKHGWISGVVIGFLHVAVAIFIGDINGGLNLYNNGFAGGFIVITVVPLIVFFKEVFGKSKKNG